MDNKLANKEQKNWVHYKLNKGEKIFLCKKCLTLSTRPRVQFDKDGVCNACRWAEDKKNKIDWKKRWKELEELCNKYRRNDGYFDIIVPCSGGKDGSYVAWVMKYKLGMHPLCVTMAPQMPSEIGRTNLVNFINSGYDVIQVYVNPESYRKLSIIGLKEEGRPKMPFDTGVTTTVVRVAMAMRIPWIMYGENGETEYAGLKNFDEKPWMNREETVGVYYCGYEPTRHLGKLGLTKNDLWWWETPTQEEFDKTGTLMTFWSYFEDWDPELHAKVSEEKCGRKSLDKPSVGTFTGYAQLDDKLQDLHAYMMYIKFGFGRAWSDACIEIRAGRMTREEGIEMVKKYDGIFPYVYLNDYLRYFEMTEKEFFDTIDSFRSPDIWEKIEGKWKLKFEIK